MNPNEWDNCFLLHQRAYGETSIIADIFTRSSGKISVIARGAKKPKSKFFGYLAPFCKLKVTYSGRSELKTLTNIDRDFSMSVDNFSKTSYSLLYINELLTKLLPKNSTHEELLDLYESGETISEDVLTSSTITISDLTNTDASYMQPLVSAGQSSIVGLVKKSESLFEVFIGFDHKVTEC